MRVRSPSSHSIIHPKYNTAAVITQLLNTSKTINHLRQTHAVLLKLLNKPHYYNYFLGHLLSRVLRFHPHNFYYALHVIHQLPNCKNEFLWTSLIRASVFRDLFGYSIYLYVKMHQAGVPPSAFTFSSVLNACGRIPAIFEGKQIHSRVVQSGLFGNKVIQTATLDMYAKCGCITDARDVFDRMFDRDLIAWTAMIRGYTKLGMMVDAKLLFDSMEERNSVSWTTLIAGYANMGDMKAARELYDVMLEKNAVTRVAMIAGYGKCGDVSNARRVFDEITEPEASSCVAMVACYAQNGYPKEAINMYKKMRKANLKINEVATVAAVSACAQLRDIEMSKKLTDNVEEGYCDRTLILSNALIHMHIRCGNIHLAWREFDRMSNRDVVVVGYRKREHVTVQRRSTNAGNISSIQAVSAKTLIALV
ncbi:hypothetical protein L6164_000867 [Bauhinia variegata]|uniref:Uncharacterized protein n=1 Tax=Bauhinia variegata TaxID=167791 RepID=A0ACB9Q9X9_BAUVA|nr:hypothetical protein L6164_000867 [Bauhinia variegata]